MNKTVRILKYVVCLAFTIAFLSVSQNVKAAHLDQIHDYSMWVNINEDATVDIIYDITWEVLDSDSEGPLSWAQVGIPNKHYLGYEPLTDNIDFITMDTGSEGMSISNIKIKQCL